MEDNKEKEVINRLQRTEIRFRIINMIFIAIVAVIAAVGALMIIKNDNQKTRNYIHCIVTVPYSYTTQPTQADISKVRKAINDCRY